MPNSLPRALYDDIEFDDQLALLDGAPFTGVAYANYPNGGLEVEFNYCQGLPSGIQRRWYPDGKLEQEWDAVRGRGAAWSREWYRNGVMKCERIDDGNGVPRLLREWSEDGRLLNDTTSKG